MSQTSHWQFGLLVAYILPGFVALFGIAPLVPMVAKWLQPVNLSELSVGPTVYAILAAITFGMIASCFRWLTIDHLHEWMGVRRPDWNDIHLENRLSAFNYLVEIHYRYYQFYANMIVSILACYGLNRFMRTMPFLGLRTDFAVLFLCAVLFIGSRNALSNYYTATRRLLGHVAEKDYVGATMTNGRDHESAGCTAAERPSQQDKAKIKNEISAKPEPPKAKTINPQK
jgi:hypothetical protein